MKPLIQSLPGRSFFEGVTSSCSCIYSFTMSLICSFVGLKPTQSIVPIHKASCISSSLLKVVGRPGCLSSVSPDKLFSSYNESSPLTFHIFLRFLLLFSHAELQLLPVASLPASSFSLTLLK